MDRSLKWVLSIAVVVIAVFCLIVIVPGLVSNDAKVVVDDGSGVPVNQVMVENTQGVMVENTRSG